MATTSNAAMRKKTLFHVPLFAKQTTSMRASIGTLLLAAILLSGCDSPGTPDWMRRPLRAPRDSGELVILTVRGARRGRRLQSGVPGESQPDNRIAARRR